LGLPLNGFGREAFRLCGGLLWAFGAFDDEMRADEAFALRAERLLARIDNPKRKRRFWR
jgi:hypothetical protein